MIQFVSGNTEQATELMLFNSAEILLKLELYLKNIFQIRSNTSFKYKYKYANLVFFKYKYKYLRIWIQIRIRLWNQPCRVTHALYYFRHKPWKNSLITILSLIWDAPLIQDEPRVLGIPSSNFLWPSVWPKPPIQDALWVLTLEYRLLTKCKVDPHGPTCSVWPEILTHRGSKDQWHLISLDRMRDILQ